MGFTIKYLDDGTVKANLNLKEESDIQRLEQKTTEETKAQLEQKRTGVIRE